MSDIIDHPPHYEACRVSIEPIDVCEAYDFCTGNAIKYMCRSPTRRKGCESAAQFCSSAPRCHFSRRSSISASRRSSSRSQHASTT